MPKCLWTLRYFGISIEVSPETSVLGPKCPDQFGISTEVSLDTSTEVSLDTSTEVSLDTSAKCLWKVWTLRHWHRNGLIPKCLDTEVSGNRILPSLIIPGTTVSEIFHVEFESVSPPNPELGVVASTSSCYRK